MSDVFWVGENDEISKGCHLKMSVVGTVHLQVMLVVVVCFGKGLFFSYASDISISSARIDISVK